MKNFQCHILGKKLIIKVCFIIMTADCNSLDGCSMVFGLNCNFAREKYAACYTLRTFLGISRSDKSEMLARYGSFTSLCLMRSNVF